MRVTRSSVRRERIDYIDLAAPVAHIWYTRRVPSYLGLLLDISRRELGSVFVFRPIHRNLCGRKDARQKALKRLEDEISVSERELHLKKSMVKSLKRKSNVTVKSKEIDAQIESINKAYDEGLAIYLNL